MKNILLTGAAGFIASYTAQELIIAGYNVVGVDNMNDYYDVRLKEFRLNQLKQLSSFEFHRADIENIEEIRPLFESYRFDAVINLAARAGVRYSMEDPFVYMRTNALGTLNLLELMRESAIRKYVLASTSSLYAGQPMPFDESLPVNQPISPYAATKKAAEAMSYTYHHLYDFDVSVLRYFTVYGPAGRPDMSYFRFIKWIDEGTPIQLFGDGTQARDFTYAEDIARGTVSALKDVGYEIINLGGGKNPISINTMIAIIEEYLGKKAVIEHHPFNKADMMETWANIDKANRLLDWEPTVDLREGLKRCVDWYEKNRDWLAQIEV